MDANEALEQVKQAVARVAQSISEHEARGGDPNQTVQELQILINELPDQEKLDYYAHAIAIAPQASLNDLGKQLISAMSDEQRQELARLLAKHNTTPLQ
ncbi:hypothetical protein J8F10_13565 [Gemmata sp. G18]|uniref:Uncharacterized protein n=1 Tax=Gemmata palustris TaxID=2822762 RepID=A0ABS5BRF7_9BACT|nr:hypothetical protein [Gemmata palustris]MBP3956313.1 hypothetical protein [Gemmata palustris]